MTEESRQPISVDFPLRGEWSVPTTPGKKIPSHGTDLFGQRYAYDIYRADPKNIEKFYKPNALVYYLAGVRLDECYCWNEPVYAPIGGKVVIARDGLAERQRIHVISEFFSVMRKTNAVRKQMKSNTKPDMHFIAGNHVVIESNGVFAFMAHLVNGSVKVKAGQMVEAGEQIGNLGHSGNSTAPHLHFHLMDRIDFWTAQGLPCCFKEYEVFQNGAWVKVENGIPKDTDLIRKI